MKYPDIEYSQQPLERGIYLVDVEFFKTVRTKNGSELHKLGEVKDQVYNIRNPRFVRYARQMGVVAKKADRLPDNLSKIKIHIKKITGFAVK